MSTVEPNVYDPQQVETSAQQFWDATRAFQVDENSEKPKFYCLSMLPYPSVRCTWAMCATTPSPTWSAATSA